jgi:hypothetical protein
MEKSPASDKMTHQNTFSYFHSIISYIKSRLKHVKILRLDTWLLAGEETTSKQKLTITFAGSEVSKNYIVKLAFGGQCKENYLGKTWLFNVFRDLGKKGRRCSMIITEIIEPFRILFKEKNSFYIPRWIVGQAGTVLDPSLLAGNKSLKSDLSRTRRNRFDFDVTHKISLFHDFYYNMYLAHTIKAHGNTAIIYPYEFMEMKFKKGDLLLVKKEKEYIAGTLIFYRKKGPRLLSNGVRDGNPEYVRTSSMAATYYFAARYLKAKGYEKMLLGGSRAFLKDGVLRFKGKWGQEITGTVKIGFLIKPLMKTAGVKEFLLNNPFIFMDKMKVKGAIFVESNQSISKNLIGEIREHYLLPGLSGLFIFQFGKSDNMGADIVPAEWSDKIKICSAERLF